MRRATRMTLAALAAALGTVCAVAQSPAELVKQYGLYTDFAATYRVQHIGSRLKDAAGLPGASFQIFNHDELNAMAYPDGEVFITSRMATEVTDDELAFVLGHELTHVKERHAARQSERATMGAILTAAVVAATGGSEGDVRVAADVGGALAFGHYSRKDEYKSDAGGVRLMTAIGYDPKRAADAMQHLIDRYGRGDANVPVLGWFSSHPDSRTRKSRILGLAEEMKANPPAMLPAALPMTIELAPSAVHAREWAPDYLAILIPSLTNGKAYGVPSARLTVVPPMPTGAGEAKPVSSKEPRDLPAVVVTVPAARPGFRLTLELAEMPAGGAADFRSATGTAVEGVLTWRDERTGFTGRIRAQAQRTKKAGPTAQDELKDDKDVLKLEDGKRPNVEGTLEAQVLRRLARGLAELVTAGGPVHHVRGVEWAKPKEAVRPGDYLVVTRDGEAVSEARVERVSAGTVMARVLWGVHVTTRRDTVVAVP